MTWTGAEATVAPAAWLDRDVLAKRRHPKSYRHPALDAAIRRERTQGEASLLLAARRAGVPVPVVYDADHAASVIHMERIDAVPLRDALLSDPDAVAEARLRQLGTLTARLHAAGITHGDLTTSNVLVDGAGELVLIDFGLGQATHEDEPRGVDLHLVEEALEATDARAGRLFQAFLEGYAWDGAPAVLRRLEDIRQRGRYR